MTFPWPSPISDYARDAVVDFDGDVPLISGRLLAAAAAALGGAVIEIPANRAAVVTGYLRACRQQDAIAVVSVDAAVRARGPGAGRQALRGIAAAALAAHHDRPLLVVARAPAEPDGLPLEARIARDLAAGFGCIGVADSELDGVDELEDLVRLVAAHDVAIELELTPDVGDGLLAAAIERRLPLGAIRGARVDAAGGPPRVLPLGAADPPDIAVGGRRWSIDAITAAITGPDDDVEVRTWLETSRLLRRVGATGTAGRLIDAIARLPPAGARR